MPGHRAAHGLLIDDADAVVVLGLIDHMPACVSSLAGLRLVKDEMALAGLLIQRFVAFHAAGNNLCRLPDRWPQPYHGRCGGHSQLMRLGR